MRRLLLLTTVFLLTTPSVSAATSVEFGPACGQFPSSPAATPTPSPTPSGSPAPAGCFPEEGSFVRGRVDLTATASTTGNDYLRYVELRIISRNPDIESPGTVYSKSIADNTLTREFRINFGWETPALPNAAFDFEIFAQSRFGSATVGRENITVDNFPVTPKTPTVFATTRGVSLDWDPVTDPQLIGYRIYRARTENRDTKPKSSAFEFVGQVTATSAFDNLGDNGAFWYRLSAVKKSLVTPETGIEGARSSVSEPGVVNKPSPVPNQPDPFKPATPRPRLTPRPLPNINVAKAPIPDAPFSTTLDYGDVEPLVSDYEQQEGVSLAQPEEPEDTSRPRALAISIGLFLVSAWAVLSRNEVLS